MGDMGGRVGDAGWDGGSSVLLGGIVRAGMTAAFDIVTGTGLDAQQRE